MLNATVAPAPSDFTYTMVLSLPPGGIGGNQSGFSSMINLSPLVVSLKSVIIYCDQLSFSAWNTTLYVPLASCQASLIMNEPEKPPSLSAVRLPLGSGTVFPAKVILVITAFARRLVPL